VKGNLWFTSNAYTSLLRKSILRDDPLYLIEIRVIDTLADAKAVQAQ
jgi:hypothetical protein